MVYISVVIPNYNSRKTIAKTIESLEKQTFRDFDVTIVDDGSKDNSVPLIKELIKDKKKYKLEELPENKGVSNARNVGAQKSGGRIMLFTDSDVILKTDTIQRVAEFFQKNENVDVIVGLFDKNSIFHNLASEYFNLRVYYNLINLPKNINIIYTSICAVRRKPFEHVHGFNTKMKSEFGLEDAELGFRLSESGFKIICDKNLSVFHYKRIGFFGLLKNDYKRSKSRIKLMFRKKMTKNIIGCKRFISTPKNQIYSALVMPFIWLSVLSCIFSALSLIATGVLLIFFLNLNLGYLYFVSKEKSFFTALTFYFLLLIDMTIVDFGLFFGLLEYTMGEKF